MPFVIQVFCDSGANGCHDVVGIGPSVEADTLRIATMEMAKSLIATGWKHGKWGRWICPACAAIKTGEHDG
jgi:hypothetical protein